MNVSRSSTVGMSIKPQLQNVSILCTGSRGDFQPYLALAIELKKAGYNTRILSNIAYKKYANEFDIEHTTIWDFDNEIRLKEDPDLRDAMASGDVEKFFQYSAKLAKASAPHCCQTFLAEMTNFRPDILVIGSFAEYFGWYAERLLKIPIIDVKLQTMVCTPERAPQGIPTLPDCGHFKTFLDLLEGYFDGRKAFDDAMEAMGRPGVMSVFSKKDWSEKCRDMIRGQPKEVAIICQSTLFKEILAPGSNENLVFVGPSVIDSTQQEGGVNFFGGQDIQERLENFLNVDPDNKPVYCGWGSMVCKSPEFMVEFAVKSLQLSGERGVVLSGSAGLTLDLLKQCTDDQELIIYAEKKVLFLERASHESLFPCMKCIVHHGGAGTTNAALRAGVPTIITPIFTDQFDHAHVVNELGNGIGLSKQFQHTTAEELSDAIKMVISSQDMSQRAKEIQCEVVKEDGKKIVVSMIEGYWNTVMHEDKAMNEIIDIEATQNKNPIELEEIQDLLIPDNNDLQG